MTAKEYLLQARRVRERIAQLEKCRAESWAKATTPQHGEPVTGGSIGRKSEAYASIAEAVEAEIQRLTRIRAEAVEKINRIEDNTSASLLLAYYINGLTWEQTALSIGYSYQHTVHALHPRALREMQKII